MFAQQRPPSTHMLHGEGCSSRPLMRNVPYHLQVDAFFTTDQHSILLRNQHLLTYYPYVTLSENKSCCYQYSVIFLGNHSVYPKFT